MPELCFYISVVGVVEFLSESGKIQESLTFLLYKVNGVLCQSHKKSEIFKGQ